MGSSRVDGPIGDASSGVAEALEALELIRSEVTAARRIDEARAKLAGLLGLKFRG